MEPVLQVALDHMHLKRALQAAREAVDGGADWLEAGTPLIKSEGMEVVRELKKSFPGATIVADLKTMDTGAFEVEIAAKAGADVITVMGVTDDATILEAVKDGPKPAGEISEATSGRAQRWPAGRSRCAGGTRSSTRCGWRSRSER